MMIYIAAKFLRIHAAQITCTGTGGPLLTTEITTEKLEDLTKALQVLQNGNNLAMNYLEFVESDCFEKLSLSGTTQAVFLHGELDESEDLSFMNVLHTF